jgi:ABC-2 type transport system permease protein
MSRGERRDASAMSDERRQAESQDEDERASRPTGPRAVLQAAHGPSHSSLITHHSSLPWADWWADVTLYGRLVAARLRSQMQYRTSFALMTLVSLVSTGSELLAIMIMFNHFGELAGWRVGEVALLYGLASVAFGLNEMISDGFDLFPQTIQRGEFDRVLLRPVGVFTQVLATDFQLRRLGRIAQGLAAVALAVTWTPIAWTPAKVAYLPVVVVSGAVMFMALTVLGAVLCFWTVQSIEIINTLTYGGTELASYPLPIYHELLQRFFTFVVPLAFITYFPALYILDKPDPLGLPAWVAFLTPVAASALALVAGLAWGVGVRHYQSTGS